MNIVFFRGALIYYSMKIIGKGYNNDMIFLFLHINCHVVI